MAKKIFRVFIPDMEIKNNVNFSPSFKATPVAKTINRIGNLETKIDLWKLTPKDRAFLHRLQKNTNMKVLMPNVEDGQAARWNEMLDIAVDDALGGYNTFLAVTKNKPCGIMSVKENKQHYKVLVVCTWPVEVGKKVKFAGKTLFYHLFNIFGKGKDITLRAIQDGPYKTVPKYQDLGFSITSTDRLVNMELKAPKVKSSMNKLAKTIQYSPVENGEEQNLLKVLDM